MASMATACITKPICRWHGLMIHQGYTELIREQYYWKIKRSLTLTLLLDMMQATVLPIACKQEYLQT